MTVGIYGIFDSKTDECLYVGMSKNIEQRWKSHIKLLRSKKHPRKDFVEWFHTNGAQKELLDFRLLEECENNETVLNSLEIKWFNELLPKYFGKKPSLNERWVRSEESKKKVSESLRKYRDSLPQKPVSICLNKNCNNIVRHNRNKYCSVKCANLSIKKKLNKKMLGHLILNKSRIIELYLEGKSLEEIANLFSTTKKTLSNFLKSEGVEVRKRGAAKGCSSKHKGKYINSGIDKARYSKIKELSDSGLSTRKIALVIGCSQPTIVNILSKIKKDPNLLN